jgi:mono/diheme cytochrome c family protein
LQAFLRAAPNDMPSFAPTTLSNKDIVNIAAFLQSLPGRRDPKDFPLLNQ